MKLRTLTTAELKRLLDLGDAALSDLAARGLLVKSGRNSWDAASVAGYVRHLRETAAGRRGGGGLDLATERARLTQLQSLKARLDYFERAGKLVNAEAVERDLFAVFRRTRERLLVEVPPRVGPLVAVEEDSARCEQIVEDAIREALTDLASRATRTPAASAGASRNPSEAAGDDR